MSSIFKWSGQGECQEHGPFAFTARRIGTTVVGATCPACLKHGQETANDLNVKREAAQLEVDLRRKKVIANFPLAFMDATFENYTPTCKKAKEMLEAARNYSLNFSQVLATRPVCGVVFTGVPGTGKTHIGCSMANVLMRSGYSCAYLACPSFLLLARESQRMQSQETTSGLINRYTNPHFLVLDEFGTHTTQDVDYQLLFALIDGRYQRNLPTLLITNLKNGSKADAIDARMMERIRGSNGPSLVFDWLTHRSSGPI